MESLAEQAFRHHYGQVFRYLHRRTRNDEQAEELTQRVFADAAAALAGIDPGTSVLALLYTVARRRFADEARRAARARTMPLDERLATIEHGPGVADAIAAALAALPRDRRDVVAAKLVRGLSFAEIADGLGITEAACKMRFARGVHAVRDHLEREGIEP